MADHGGGHVPISQPKDKAAADGAFFGEPVYRCGVMLFAAAAAQPVHIGARCKRPVSRCSRGDSHLAFNSIGGTNYDDVALGLPSKT